MGLKIESIHIRRLLPCLIAFIILVATIESQSLWWDEGISIHLATLRWADIVFDRASNIHPPLYFFTLKIWGQLAGLSPFSTRYLSALAATLLPAAVYGFIKPRFDARSAITASFLISIAPPFIIYGQEVRAYAFLPLFFLLLLAQLWKSERTQTWYDRVSPLWKGVLLGFSQLCFVGFHYTGFIATALVDLFLLANFLHTRKRSDILILVTSVITIAVLSLPWWATVYVTGLDNASRQAGLSNPFSDPIPFDYLIKLLAYFNATGLPEAVSDMQMTRVLSLSLILGILLFGLRVIKPKAQKILTVLLIWLLPFFFVPFIWWLSPQSHPRYLMPFYVGGWLMTAVLVRQRVISHALRLCFLASTLVGVLLGLQRYFFVERFSRSDIRAAAAYMKEDSLPGDTVFVPYTDWSLPQYDTGHATVVMLPDPQDEALIAQEIAALDAGSRVFLLDYSRNVIDPRNYVRFLLSRQGYANEKMHFNKVYLERFILEKAYHPISCRQSPAVCVEGEALCVTGADVQEHVVSGTMLPIALCWRADTVSKRYGLAFRLYTETGILVSSVDDVVVDDLNRPSDLWVNSHEFRSYHRLPLPAGLLPETYKVEMSIYPVNESTTTVSLITDQGKRIPAVDVANISPAGDKWVNDSPETVLPDVTARSDRFGNGLALVGSQYAPKILRPGGKIYITLLWQVQEQGSQDGHFEILMRQKGSEIASVDTWGEFGELPVNRPVLDYISISAPKEVTGELELYLHSDTPENEFLIGTVSIDAVEHIFTIPAPDYLSEAYLPGTAFLTGYQIEPENNIKSGQPFSVTLIWQAGDRAAEQDLKVFVHLVNEDGDIVAQHDAQPADWTRPTNGWLTGEYIEDIHLMHWIKTGSGVGNLVVGMYDSADGTRLVWDNGEDALKLSLHIQY